MHMQESARCLYERLRNLGFDVSPSEIFTSLSAAKRVIQEEKLHPMLLLSDSALEDFEGKLLIDQFLKGFNFLDILSEEF